ncbi:MAG: 4-alpha-glucanotransferase [Bacteroidales bacterium]|nr:4-alpha-glucanotransferase [Bacteroidales bacterium]
MKIKISVRYVTQWGEKVVLNIGKRSLNMKSIYGGLWEKELSAKDFDETHDFTFSIVKEGKVIRREWQNHTLRLPETGNLDIRSRWLDRPANSAFWSSAFKDVIFSRQRGEAGMQEGNVTFSIPGAEIRPDQAVAIAGTKGKTLHGWDKPILLNDWNFPMWSIDLDVKDAFEYKFLVVDRKTLEPIVWETGANHLFAEIPAKGKRLALADQDPQFPLIPWKGAGVAIPVFSLRTEDSFGVGEFHDIKKLVDWAVATGQNVIQLLPINDTTMTHTWTDSYPYNANSSFALHPQFLHLPALGIRADKAYKVLKDELNALDKVDYEKVNEAKIRYVRKAFEKQGKKVMESPEYKKFVSDNAYWLLPYAAYCAIREVKGTADFSQWGAYAKYSQKKVDAFVQEHQSEVDFHCYVQYQLDAQLKESVAYAHKHGVVLKGDLPIGVSRISCDAWTFPALFHMDSQAGAPPDAFAVDGQNWGFPTYNWEKMAEDGYAWWKNRLRKMNEYFDAFRIDHILGFFRIWEIPVKYKTGLMGYFNPAVPFTGDELRQRGFDISGGRYVTPQEGWDETDVLFIEDPRKKGCYHPRISAPLSSKAYFALDDGQKARYNSLYNDFFYHRNDACWKESAYKKLPELLESTGMLACGEDLGMIPACVPETMADLNILSLEIQRMPKDPKVLFGNPATYPYLCVCATGTHDMAPLRAWWEEDRTLTARFYHENLHHIGDAPYFCEPWVCEEILFQHMESPAMMAILPLQDWIAIDGDVRYPGNPVDERINVPAIPRYYWRFRMHCTLESLIANTKLNKQIGNLIHTSGRGR